MMTTLTSKARKVNGPRTPPMRTQRMSELIMIISIGIKVERTIIKGGGFGSEVSGSLIKKKALLAPQVSDKTDTTILMIWFKEIFPELHMMMS